MTDGYAGLRREAAWLDVSDRGRIIARGRDRARLLHNLTSNEVKKMRPGEGCYAFLLSPQGRIQADLSLLCFVEHFLIDTEAELREKVLQHIRRYIIADLVELEDLSSVTGAIALEGPQASAVLAGVGAPAPDSAYGHQPWEDATVAAVTLTGQPGYRIYCDASRTAQIIARLAGAGAAPATPEDFRTVRIENGRPRYGEDIRDTSLPQETQQLHAVSFTKGCYLGQEIVERIRAQGHVNKKLVRLKISLAQPPAAGSKLNVNGADAGEITSAVRSGDSDATIGLAYVRSNYAEPGTELQVDGGVARVEPV